MIWHLMPLQHITFLYFVGKWEKWAITPLASMFSRVVCCRCSQNASICGKALIIIWQQYKGSRLDWYCVWYMHWFYKCIYLVKLLTTHSLQNTGTLCDYPYNKIGQDIQKHTFRGKEINCNSSKISLLQTTFENILE